MNTVIPANILVVSPHLDDAVLSCGDLLSARPYTTVVTVFAGTPLDPEVLTDWDATSGFSSAGAAMQSRRQEDRAALQLLGATPRWLDFLDSQYGDSPSTSAVAKALSNLLDETEPAAVLYPAGLFHSDHVLVHKAILQICSSYPQIKWLMYEEASYRCIAGLLQFRLQALLNEGWQATPVADIAKQGQCKRDALQCYSSQLRALKAVVRDGYSDAFAAERYWAVQSSPAA
jgi:LmbE family N-acetylglucosaminyl deacetylase